MVEFTKASYFTVFVLHQTLSFVKKRKPWSLKKVIKRMRQHICFSIYNFID